MDGWLWNMQNVLPAFNSYFLNKIKGWLTEQHGTIKDTTYEVSKFKHWENFQFYGCAFYPDIKKQIIMESMYKL